MFLRLGEKYLPPYRMELKSVTQNQTFTVLSTPLIIHNYKHFADFPQQT